MKVASIASSLIILAIIVTGCQNTAEGVQKDAEINGQKVTQVTENAGSKVKDAGAEVKAAVTLTPEVKSALRDNAELKEYVDSFDVDSTEKTVTLNGKVPSGHLKDLAGSIAAKVVTEKGQGQTLENKLVVAK